MSYNSNSPPLRVLALTGPHGSGCSTVAEFFDVPGRSRREPNELLRVLLEEQIVLMDPQPCVNWAHLNQSITDSVALSGEGRPNKDALEDRELAHVFRLLFTYYPSSGHLFRTISVSDLIVFHAMRALEERHYDASSVPPDYASFVTTVNEHRKETIEGIQRALERLDLYGLRHYYAELHKERDESTQKRIVSAFGLIHGLSSRVKKHMKRLHPREYISLLQDFGNNLRRCGDPFDTKTDINPQCSFVLARDTARVIRLLHTNGLAAFFVVDSLRNPFEILFLRHEFADCFVVSLYADKEIRAQRVGAAVSKLSDGEMSYDRAVAVFEDADHRDSGADIRDTEDNLFKQNVPKCVQLSDIAINNGTCATDVACLSSLCYCLVRPLCLILEPGCTRPTEDEVFMNQAYTLAVKSNCISRQVGAVIVGPHRYVVGAGWNEVGKGLVSCGLRAIADLREDWSEEMAAAIEPNSDNVERLLSELAASYGDGLSHAEREQCRFCFKDVMADRVQRPKLINALHRRCEAMGVEAGVRESIEEFFTGVVNDVTIHQLEYCLALHAEENAILQGAKIGGMGLKGGKIYTTAEPCTLCAKKIHQVGLKEVIYTEPYPKSMPAVYMPGVEVRQFEGVKPRAYIRLFMPHHDRKDWQELCVRGLLPNI